MSPLDARVRSGRRSTPPYRPTGDAPL